MRQNFRQAKETKQCAMLHYILGHMLLHRTFIEPVFHRRTCASGLGPPTPQPLRLLATSALSSKISRWYLCWYLLYISPQPNCYTILLIAWSPRTLTAPRFSLQSLLTHARICPSAGIPDPKWGNKWHDDPGSQRAISSPIWSDPIGIRARILWVLFLLSRMQTLSHTPAMFPFSQILSHIPAMFPRIEELRRRYILVEK